MNNFLLKAFSKSAALKERNIKAQAIKKEHETKCLYFAPKWEQNSGLFPTSEHFAVLVENKLMPIKYMFCIQSLNFQISAESLL